MIIRKPYAFLIKNFKKIHIFLLVLSLYVAYKLLDVNSFVNEFMKYGTYDLFRDPISNHITLLLTISLLLLIIGSLALVFLLRYKKKPWKVYLFPAVEYFALLLVLGMIKGFFRGYTTEVAITDLRMSKDLLLISILAQVPAIAIYMMRVFGWDIKKFNFNSDQEFLELSEKDREEIEIGINIDKNSFKRGYKRALRNLNYFYLEHKNIYRTVIGVLSKVILFSLYRTIFIVHKSYKVGDNYYVNGYTFKVNNAYYTDKDFNGNVISDKSNFIVIDLTIKNNDAPRTVYLENFHIKNGTKDYVTTNKTYSKEFRDLGNTYETTRELKRDEELDCIIVYKVDKNLNKNRFVLYYQEGSGYLRKIKLNTKDLSNMEDVKKLELGDEIDLGFRNNSDVISFNEVDISEKEEYTFKSCGMSGCGSKRGELVLNGNNRILRIDFGSEVWEAKNMIDFIENYGKIVYKDSNNEKVVLKVDNPISTTYYGKSIFLRVPVELENAKEVSFELIVRNKQYIYKLI